jgi:prepilin-type N-terminal cleavage/methylation domain-containing protein
MGGEPAGARARHRQAPPAGPPPGFSLLELLAGLALLGLLVIFAVPLVAETVARERLHAAAMEEAVEFRRLRQRAVSEQVSFGLRFVAAGAGWSRAVYRDGNGNGIRTTDIVAGRDRLIEGPVQPGDRYEGIRYGLPAGPLPAVPPDGGAFPNPGDPIKFGSGDIVSFSPGGSVSSGSVYLTDGRRAAAVVVFGATGRVRLFRYRPEDGWREGI